MTAARAARILIAMRHLAWFFLAGAVACGTTPEPAPRSIVSIESSPVADVRPDKAWVKAPAPLRAKVAPVFAGRLFAGQGVLVAWHGAYYPARILRVVDPTHALIHYDGHDASWDEVVGPDRLVTGQRLDGQGFDAPVAASVPSPPSTSTPPAGSFAYDFRRAGVGDRVTVEWHGSWWDAHVERVVGPKAVLIHYDGWGHEWDETVGPARLRAR